MSDIAKAHLRELQDRLGWDSYVQDTFANRFQETSDRYSLPPLTGDDVRDGPNSTSVPSVLNGITILGKSLEHPPLVAILPTSDFNACATLAPDRYPIVLLEARLESLLVYLSTALGKLVLVDRDFQAACYIILMTSLDAAYPGASPDVPKMLNPDQLPRDLSSLDYVFKMTAAFERFVVAHEFAHHVLGHLNSMTTMSVNGINDAIRLDVFSRAQQEELDADSLAYDIYIADLHSQPYDETGRYDVFDALPIVFLKFLQIVCALRGVESDSHPPPEKRVEQLLPKFKTVARGKAMSWFTPIASTFDNVWPRFLEYIDGGGREGQRADQADVNKKRKD